MLTSNQYNFKIVGLWRSVTEIVYCNSFLAQPFDLMGKFKEYDQLLNFTLAHWEMLEKNSDFN